MPTQAEYQELRDNTAREWVAFIAAGVRPGEKRVSSADASCYILFLAAQCFYDGTMGALSYDGYFWSATHSDSFTQWSNTPNAFHWYFNQGTPGGCGSYAYRYYALNVRGCLDLS